MAFAVTLEATAADDVLDLLDILITEIFSDATKAGEKARLRSIKDLDLAASQLGLVCHLILDPDVPDAELRAAIFKTLQREELESALGQWAVRDAVCEFVRVTFGYRFGREESIANCHCHSPFSGVRLGVRAASWIQIPLVVFPKWQADRPEEHKRQRLSAGAAVEALQLLTVVFRNCEME